MRDFDPGLGDQIAQFAGLGDDRVDAVVHEEDLAAAFHFAQDGLADQPPS